MSKKNIPDGWKHLELGKVCNVLMGQSPSGDTINQLNNGMAFLQGNAEFGEKYPIEKYWTTNPTKIAKKNSLLLSVRAPVGELNIADKSYCIGRGLASIDSDNLILNYLYFFISKNKYQFKIFSQGSTFEAINRKNIEKIKILIPSSKQEQKKIAKILSEVDNTIEITKKLIEKNKRIKTALMQDLLKYGIDKKGNIRDPKTHKFKPSPLGDIPNEWECVKLGEVCDVRDGTHETPKYTKDGIPFVTSKNLTDNGIDFTDIKYISKEDHKKISIRSKVENDDILFGMIGTIGNPVIVKTSFEFSIKNVALIKKTKPYFNVIYLLNFLKSDFFNKNITNVFNGGVQNFISLNTVRQLLVLKPSKTEQQKIADILSAQDEKIKALETKLKKLQHLKTSLMQDLLSGKVRVTKLLESKK